MTGPCQNKNVTLNFEVDEDLWRALEDAGFFDHLPQDHLLSDADGCEATQKAVDAILHYIAHREPLPLPLINLWDELLRCMIKPTPTMVH